MLNDAFTLAESGHLPYTIALDMTLYLDKEYNFMPWKTVKPRLDHLIEKLYNTEAALLLQVKQINIQIYIYITMCNVKYTKLYFT